MIIIKSNVLVIDTDLENCKQIKYNLLSMTDVEVYYTQSVSEAFGMMQDKQYSLVIMDVSLSTVEGIEMLSAARQINDCPLFILSEKASSTERVLALRIGADDVLNKPYDLDECLARAFILMQHETQRHPTSERKYVVVGHKALMIDTARRAVVVSGNDVELTRKEYELLLYLFINRNMVLSYEQIYEAVWHEGYFGINSSIFNHIRKLRKKLGIDGLIDAVYGVGYRFNESVIR